MKRWGLRALAGLGLGTLVLGALSSSSSASRPSGGAGASWPARWAVLEPHARKLEEESGWIGLTDFLAVVAWMESRGDLNSTHDGGVGRGPFALHYTTGAVQALGGKPALPLLTDPRVAVATAATHAANLLSDPSRDFPKEDTRWADIRAGWAIPTWTGTRNTQAAVKGKRRASVVATFTQRAAQLGRGYIPTAKAWPPSKWPGLKWALETLGSPVAAEVR